MCHMIKTVSLLLLLAGATPAANPEPLIIPAVQQWQGAEGTLDIQKAPIILAARDEKLLRPTAELMRAELADKPEILVGEKPAGKPAITFALTDKPFAAGNSAIEEQSYGVEITATGVTI